MSTVKVIGTINSSNLQHINGIIHDINTDFTICKGPLDNESINMLIEGMSSLSTPKTVKISNSIYNKLTAEQVALIKTKIWYINITNY